MEIAEQKNCGHCRYGRGQGSIGEPDYIPAERMTGEHCKPCWDAEQENPGGKRGRGPKFTGFQPIRKD
jgi:hypothetical protein